MTTTISTWGKAKEGGGSEKKGRMEGWVPILACVRDKNKAKKSDGKEASKNRRWDGMGWSSSVNKAYQLHLSFFWTQCGGIKMWMDAKKGYNFDFLLGKWRVNDDVLGNLLLERFPKQIQKIVLKDFWTEIQNPELNLTKNQAIRALRICQIRKILNSRIDRGQTWVLWYLKTLFLKFWNLSLKIPPRLLIFNFF